MHLKAREKVCCRPKLALSDARRVGQLFMAGWRKRFGAHALAYLAQDFLDLCVRHYACSPPLAHRRAQLCLAQL
jgi:hypothetical protein